MGFQRMQENQQNMESLIRAISIENGERITSVKTPIICDLQTKGPDPSSTEPLTSDDNYASWLMKHPSALSMFDGMMNAAKGKTIVVFLDYDGTLTPIVADPDQAIMSEEMRSAVRDVADRFPTAIISGRCRDKVYNFVQLTKIYYAGSHGMDIMLPIRNLPLDDGNYQTRTLDEMGSEVVAFQPAQEFLPTMQEILKELEERTKTIRGVKIEDNKFCVSVHFRNIDKEDYFELEEQVESVLQDYTNIHLTRGRKVLEIRPSIKWDKGHALEYLLDALGFGDSDDVLPMYIGDDRTDEDAFKVIQSRGEGFPIIVSSIPKETNASYSLRDPLEVMSFLVRLAEWWNS